MYQNGRPVNTAPAVLVLSSPSPPHATFRRPAARDGRVGDLVGSELAVPYPLAKAVSVSRWAC